MKRFEEAASHAYFRITVPLSGGQENGCLLRIKWQGSPQDVAVAIVACGATTSDLPLAETLKLANLSQDRLFSRLYQR
jgi:hypothetical protein